jgi:hypothetical protein
VAESLLEQGGYVRPREVIAIVAGTRTKSGSTNFLRLHVMGEHNQEGVRFFAPREEEHSRRPLRRRSRLHACGSRSARHQRRSQVESSSQVIGRLRIAKTPLPTGVAFLFPCAI